MRKVISVILAVILIFSIPTTASAESTTLTIDVPEASYILNVPADQAIDYLASEKNIGSITVSDTSGFSASKGISVSVTYDGQFATPKYASAINYSLVCKGTGSETRYDLNSGDYITFTGNADGTLNNNPTLPDGSPANELIVLIDTACWDTALGGIYSTTITFNADVYFDVGM